jgi:hypothetical protein
MRERHVRDGLDFLHLEDPKVPLPLVEPIQRVMVRADIDWRGVATRRSIEHSAERDTVDHAAMDAEAHNATRVVVHHDEHPMRPQDRRFAPKQVEAPQTVLRVTEDREPGWAS